MRKSTKLKIFRRKKRSVILSVLKRHSLRQHTVDQEKIDKEKEYSILLTDATRSILEKTTPGCRIKQLPDMTLSSAWTAFMEKGQQPLAPEDYIEVEK